MAAENIDNTVNGTGLFPAKVPGLADAADIQAALKLYHYGSYTYDGSNTNTANLVAPSIAKHLQNLKDADTAAAAALAAHETDTTNIHGIVNTANLATQAFVTTSITNAVNGATGGYPTLAGDAIDWNSVDLRFDVEPRIANVGTIVTKTESFILSPDDVGKTAILYSSNPIVVTLPADASVEIPIGYAIDIIQTGSGLVTVSEGSGAVSINSKSNIKSLDGQYSKGTLVKIDTNTWFFFGNSFSTTTPTPVAPTPVAPTPVAPTPVAPTPVAPTPVAPTPVAPTPVAPTPVAPTPVAPTAPTPTPPQLPTPTLSVTSSGYNTYPNFVYANIGIGNYDYLNTYTSSSAGWTQNPEFPEEWNVQNISPNSSQTVYITASRAGYTSATGSLTFTSHYVSPVAPTAPTPTAPSVTYIMPNVVGMTESAAATAINGVGINYEFTNIVNNANGATAQNTGTVKAQNPAAGTYAPELAGAGTGATLDVYNYTAAPTPTAPGLTTYYACCTDGPMVQGDYAGDATAGDALNTKCAEVTGSTRDGAVSTTPLNCATTPTPVAPTPTAPTPTAPTPTATLYYAYGCCNGDPLVIEGPSNQTARADYQSVGGCTASGVSSTYSAALTGAQAACGSVPNPVAPTPTAPTPTAPTPTAWATPLSGYHMCTEADAPNPNMPSCNSGNIGSCVNNSATGASCTAPVAPVAPTPTASTTYYACCSSGDPMSVSANSASQATSLINNFCLSETGTSISGAVSTSPVTCGSTPTPVAPTPTAPTPTAPTPTAWATPLSGYHQCTDADAPNPNMPSCNYGNIGTCVNNSATGASCTVPVAPTAPTPTEPTPTAPTPTAPTPTAPTPTCTPNCQVVGYTCYGWTSVTTYTDVNGCGACESDEDPYGCA